MKVRLLYFGKETTNEGIVSAYFVFRTESPGLS